MYPRYLPLYNQGKKRNAEIKKESDRRVRVLVRMKEISDRRDEKPCTCVIS
jgi:hypothetical protein